MKLLFIIPFSHEEYNTTTIPIFAKFLANIIPAEFDILNNVRRNLGLYTKVNRPGIGMSSTGS